MNINDLLAAIWGYDDEVIHELEKIEDLERLVRAQDAVSEWEAIPVVRENMQLALAELKNELAAKYGVNNED